MRELFFIVIAFLSASVVCGQDRSAFFHDVYLKNLEGMNLTYSKPKGFSESNQIECFEKNYTLSSVITCAPNNLLSDDGECIVFLAVHPKVTQEFEDKARAMFPNTPIRVNNGHIIERKRLIRAFYPKVTKTTMSDITHFYSDREAKDKFNADTAFFVNIALNKPDRYLDKYSNLYVQTIQKNDQGFIIFYMLYTDKAKKRLRKYLKPLMGIYKYY